MWSIDDLKEFNNIELVSEFVFLISKYEHEKNPEEAKKLSNAIKDARKEIQNRMKGEEK